MNTWNIFCYSHCFALTWSCVVECNLGEQLNENVDNTHLGELGEQLYEVSTLPKLGNEL